MWTNLTEDVPVMVGAYLCWNDVKLGTNNNLHCKPIPRIVIIIDLRADVLIEHHSHLNSHRIKSLKLKLKCLIISLAQRVAIGYGPTLN